jgi:ABC-type Mn2+/Zn2+ transport system permease subunit
LSPAVNVGTLLKGGLIILSGALMILPAYLNYLIFSRLHFELVVSLSISLTLFALGILIFILTVGTETFERKR